MKFWKIFDSIIDGLGFLAGIIIIFTMITVSTDVTLRYTLNKPITWSTEITEVSLLYIAFLGITWLLKKEGHVNVDIILIHLKPKSQALLGILSSVVGVFIAFILVWYGAITSFQYTVQGIAEPTILELPKGPLMTIIPLGSFFLLFQFVRRAYNFWVKWKALSGKETQKVKQGIN